MTNNEKVLETLKKYMYVCEKNTPGNFSGENEIWIDCVETEATKEDFETIKNWLEKGKE